MSNITLIWDAPNTRTSGRALKPGDIAGYVVEQSHDGAAFVRLTDNAAALTQRELQNVGPGDWRFRVACFDSKNKTGEFAEGAVTVDDDSPPSIVLNLRVSVSASLATHQG